MKNWNEAVFSYKINFLIEDFYEHHFIYDQNLYNVEGHFIEFFGFNFEFRLDSETFVLVDACYSAIELICMGECFLRYMASINKLGFITEDALNDTFMIHIKNHLVSLGYEEKLLGNSEIT